MAIIDVPAYALIFIFQSIDILWAWMNEVTLFDIPLVFIVMFLFMFCCCYRFIIAPFFSGGVSVTASDSVKMAGKSMNNANNYNIRHQSEIRYKTNIRNL